MCKDFLSQSRNKTQDSQYFYALIVIILLFLMLGICHSQNKKKQRRKLEKICEKTKFPNDEISIISVDAN